MDLFSFYSGLLAVGGLPHDDRIPTHKNHSLSSYAESQHFGVSQLILAREPTIQAPSSTVGRRYTRTLEYSMGRAGLGTFRDGIPSVTARRPLDDSPSSCRSIALS